MWVAALALILVALTYVMKVSGTEGHGDPEGEQMVQHVVEHVHERIPHVFARTQVYFSPWGQSYTVDKAQVYLCPRDSKGALVPFDKLVHMLVHELAHVMTPEIGHTALFKATFRDLLGRL